MKSSLLKFNSIGYEVVSSVSSAEIIWQMKRINKS